MTIEIINTNHERMDAWKSHLIKKSATPLIVIGIGQEIPVATVHLLTAPGIPVEDIERTLEAILTQLKKGGNNTKIIQPC